MSQTFYAHSDPDGKSLQEGGQWQKLEDHLKNTAKLAGKFAADFGAYEWGYIEGYYMIQANILRDFKHI